LGKNIYSAGLNTLGKLSRTTADIVVSTREKLVPLLEKSVQGQSKIDRVEMKKSFSVLFDEFCGNDALEKLQIQSTQASILMKKKLKALNPQQLKAVQIELKGVGSLLDNIEASNSELEWPDIFSKEEGELVGTLQFSFKDSIAKFENFPVTLEELRGNVDSPLPPDNPSLIIYLVRYHLAKMLSAFIHLLLLISPTAETLPIHQLGCVIRGNLESVIRVAETDLLDSNRSNAVKQLIAVDISQAQTTLRDALLLLQPQLRLAKLVN
jgi:hypothetical protein